MRPPALEVLDALPAILGDLDRYPHGFHQPGQQQLVFQLVFHDQHAISRLTGGQTHHLAALGFFGLGDVLLLDCAHRQIDPEQRTLAQRAFQREASPHQLHELAGDGQPQSGAFAVALLAQLHEGLEDALLVLGRDAGAGVFDLDHQVGDVILFDPQA